MPSTIISHSSKPDAKIIKGPTSTFTGDVYLDMMFAHKESGTAMANVTFTPCARTNWHSHEQGQILTVLHGTGWICDKGAEPRKIKAGDLIWAAPGTVHWHGATKESVMTHTACGLGKTEWLEAVTEEEYAKAE